LLVRAFQKFGKLEDNVRKLIKNPIAKIACGAFHSMAIDRDGKLFSWGEAKCGQTGTGRKSKEPLPKEVPVPGFIAEVSGGFGHSACVNKLG
jgi:alpha-tubulin suppressor-like RCC1 family protein